MKVCTDACILGASTEVEKATRVLDIGTGTGLLAIMVAQRSLARVDAVEMEENAYRQAVQNAETSPFAARIQVYHQRIQDFTVVAPARYDVIVTNPPFFRNHLLSPSQQRNTAMHTATLSFGELLHSVAQLLQPQGKCFVLLPVYESQLFETEATPFGLHTTHRLMIRHSDRHPFFRSILTLGWSARTAIEEELTIYKAEQVYSDAFRHLLKDYYLLF
jgi:tRNA1Val (adenine37-N6)-methyltransferase